MRRMTQLQSEAFLEACSDGGAFVWSNLLLIFDWIRDQFQAQSGRRYRVKLKLIKPKHRHKYSDCNCKPYWKASISYFGLNFRIFWDASDYEGAERILEKILAGVGDELMVSRYPFFYPRTLTKIRACSNLEKEQLYRKT